jgi:hypothetical protein
MPRSRRSTWGRLWRCHLCNPGQAGVREDARCSSEAGDATGPPGTRASAGLRKRCPEKGAVTWAHEPPVAYTVLPSADAAPMLAWFAGGAFQANQNGGRSPSPLRPAGVRPLESSRHDGERDPPPRDPHARRGRGHRQRSRSCARASLGRHVPLLRPRGDAPGNRRFPFATIVIKVSAGFDTASNLNRPGVFPLNIAVGRDKFRELIGYSPAAHTDIEQTSTTRRGPAAPAPGLRIAILGLHPELGCGEQRARARPVVPRSDPSQRTPPAAAVAHFMRRSAAAWGPLRPDEPGAMRSHLALERVLQPQTPDAPR